MALAKDETHHGAQSYYGELVGGGGGIYEFDEAAKSSGTGINIMISRSSSLSSPSSTNSNNHLYRAMNYQHEEGHSVISFKGGFNNNFVHADGSLLSFDRDDYSNLEQFPTRGITNVRLLENFNSIQTASRTMKSNHYGDHDEPFGWLNSEETTASDTIDQELIAEEPSFHKRPATGESMQTLKKQCTSANSWKPKPMSSTQSSKDPQSIAAKNRRERISARLKILQDLVPNGSKVDLVTMLEKAISYVKFLQLQVKVLATDELWPVQGGKAPELSQVKDAINAILASQRDANSSSK